MALLQGLNLLAMVGTALQALNPSQKFAFSTSSAAVLLAALFVAVYRSLPLGSVRCAYPGLSLALGLTLVSWLLVQLVLVETPFEVWPAHFRMAMRALFLGPLGLFAVIFIKCIVGRNRTLTVMAALCVGQYAIGLIELGVRLDSKFLIYAALTSIPAFFVLTFLSISRTRHAQGDVNH